MPFGYKAHKRAMRAIPADLVSSRLPLRFPSSGTEDRPQGGLLRPLEILQLVFNITPLIRIFRWVFHLRNDRPVL